MLEYADREKLPRQAADLSRFYGQPVIPGRNRHIEQIDRELTEYFGGERQDFSVPLDLKGLDAPVPVWQASHDDAFSGPIGTPVEQRRSRTEKPQVLLDVPPELDPLARLVGRDRDARWILLDYWDVVAHIFTPEAREYYRLESLWGEAPVRSVG